MTVMHLPPDAAVTAAVERDSFIADLLIAIVWLKENPDAELPDGRTFSKRVYGVTYGDKVEALHAIADSWGVPVRTAPDGVKVASVEFGSVRFAATVSPPDASLADYLDRISNRPEVAA